MRIAFIWQGFDTYAYRWEDGLRQALRVLTDMGNDVGYFDFPLGAELHDFKPDVVLYWEAPITNQGKDKDNWNAVCALPYKKALMFAGGPLRAIDVMPFDLLFVESKVNEEDCERQGIPYKKAFGVNTQVMKPEQRPIYHDAFMQATFAEWKRHDLFARAMGSKGAVAGRLQEFDRNGYNECVKRQVIIFPELKNYEVAEKINESYCVLNTANEQGGGQRCTLEGLACGVPVIVMADSVKNREYIEESGAGLIVEPNEGAIQEAVERCKKPNWGHERAVDYILGKYTERHYAENILEGIKSL